MTVKFPLASVATREYIWSSESVELTWNSESRPALPAESNCFPKTLQPSPSWFRLDQVTTKPSEEFIATDEFDLIVGRGGVDQEFVALGRCRRR